MNIYIVGPSHPYRGGIAKFNDVLAQNFVAAGHSVKMVNFSMLYPRFVFSGKSQFTDSPSPDGVEMVRCINSINPCSWIRTARMIRGAQPDLVIVRYWMPFMAPALGTIARRCSCPVVALADNILPPKSHFYDFWLTRYFLKSIDSVVYMSAKVGEELTQFHFKGTKAFTPHPVYDIYGDKVSKSEAAARLGLSEAPDYVMFFGFILDYKGLDLLLAAWADLPMKVRQGRKLLVAGEFYEPRQKYDELIAGLGIATEVIIRDSYIAETDVRFYFSLADVVVQPYKTATQSGITQVAYHFSTPMIVTDVGGLAEIVTNGKVGYVTAVDVHAIADAIATFYNQGRKREFEHNILLEKQRFSWSNMMNTLINVCKKNNK